MAISPRYGNYEDCQCVGSTKVQRGWQSSHWEPVDACCPSDLNWLSVMKCYEDMKCIEVHWNACHMSPEPVVICHHWFPASKSSWFLQWSMRLSNLCTRLLSPEEIWQRRILTRGTDKNGTQWAQEQHMAQLDTDGLPLKVWSFSRFGSLAKNTKCSSTTSARTAPRNGGSGVPLRLWSIICNVLQIYTYD